MFVPVFMRVCVVIWPMCYVGRVYTGGFPVHTLLTRTGWTEAAQGHNAATSRVSRTLILTVTHPVHNHLSFGPRDHRMLAGICFRLIFGIYPGNGPRYLG